MECCGAPASSAALVHACKHPCHSNQVSGKGQVSPAHPLYLAVEAPRQLFLNLIDPPRPLFRPESFLIFARWMAGQVLIDAAVTIHCNEGRSRAPALALFWLAISGAIRNESFDTALDVYLGIDREFRPGRGIERFLRENWLGLLDLLARN